VQWSPAINGADRSVLEAAAKLSHAGLGQRRNPVGSKSTSRVAGSEVGAMPGARWVSPVNGSISCSRQLQGRGSASISMAFGWLATPDHRATAAHDHAATPLTTASCSTACSNRAEDSSQSGRSERFDLKNRTETLRNRHGWTEYRLIRDREAPGSNPGTQPVFFRKVGPPTKRGASPVVCSSRVRERARTIDHVSVPSQSLSSSSRWRSNQYVPASENKLVVCVAATEIAA
jgi:hypothetical protein